MVGTAYWRGIRLSDVLTDARVQEGSKFIEFIGADISKETGKPYAISLPVEKCLDPR